jgi:GAF domain-containing protein
MAADQQEKRRTLAKNVVTQATIFIDSHGELQQALAEATDAGLTFTDADFAGQPNLTHLDAATFNAIAAVITAMESAMQQVNPSNGLKHKQVLNRFKP